MATSRSFQAFARRMRFRADELEKNANRTVRKVALAADQAIVVATPVDTGQARSNWLVSLLSPRADTIPPYVAGMGGSTGAQNVIAAQAQGASVIGTRQPGQDVWISNNLPYIGRLNNGFSAQAPANFVQAAAAEAASVVANARLFEAP